MGYEVLMGIWFFGGIGIRVLGYIVVLKDIEIFGRGLMV